MIRKVIKIILVLLWMVMIFLLSNEEAVKSSKKSDGLIIKSVELFTGKSLSDQEKEKVLKYLVFPVRKCAHLSLYLLLGILVISLLREYMVINTKLVLLSLLICFLYACSDEIHQLFVPGRSGEARDVLIDTLGACLGVSFYYLVFRKKKMS
ncbi:MAG: VanZ family protein [Tenericutes bacterium]|nr:VanZ family protein [Mycoplasmatota bacterium]MDD6942384.1 VanZ family protein [bacterium]MDY2697603.1 VanZ family protein [Bacilli bacterium]